MRRLIPAAAAALAMLLSSSASWALCVGDCNVNDRVAVNELILGVNIALGSNALEQCSPCDANGNGAVAVGELIQAVNNALFGCGDGPTATPTPVIATATPTITNTPSNGPRIVFFGVTNADDSLASPSGEGPGGVPIYERPFGFSFSLLIEAKPGPSGLAPGLDTFVEGGVPDLQVQVTRALGDGSSAVCDVELPNYGGVPGIDPPRLDEPAQIADALNDLGCRFIDGVGDPSARACDGGCVRFDSGQYGCAVDDTVGVRQYCAPVPQPMAFPSGDTLVTARLRDPDDNLGDPARIIVRISSP
ncbi:MAG: hypothetical protein ACRERC_02410 [Candidatus Binatia bacterium]